MEIPAASRWRNTRQTMTTNEILALTPGPALDQAVHNFVYSNAGKCKPYSTKDTHGIALLDRLPLFVARLPDNHPTFDPSRPFAAGTLAHNADLKGDMTALRVTAPTRLVALCKAALLVVLRPAKADRATIQQSPEAAAKAVAARIGTPAARGPGAAARVAQPTSRVHANDRRQPLPRRTERFTGPTPPVKP